MRKIGLSVVIGALALLGLPGLSFAQHGGHHGGGFSHGAIHGGSFSHGAIHHGGFTHGGFHTGGIHTGGLNHGYYHGGYNHYGHYRGFGTGLYLGSPSYSYGYGYPSYGYNYAYPDYGSSYVYEPSYTYVQPTTVVPPGAYAPLNLGTTVMPPVEESTTVTVDVVVPETAEVWFDGYKTNQAGSSRTFVSPPLEPGHSYTYDVRARWTDPSGRVIDETKQVAVQAGQEVTLNFMAR